MLIVSDFKSWNSNSDNMNPGSLLLILLILTLNIHFIYLECLQCVRHYDKHQSLTSEGILYSGDIIHPGGQQT